MESVHSLTTCRVLVVPRHRYDQLVSSFPLSARAVLLNLQRQCEQVCTDVRVITLTVSCDSRYLLQCGLLTRPAAISIMQRFKF